MKFIKTFRRLFLIFCLILASVYIYGNYAVYTRERETMLILSEEIYQIRQRIVLLTEEIDNALEDEHVERAARRYLGLIKEDEILFMDVN